MACWQSSTSRAEDIHAFIDAFGEARQPFQEVPDRWSDRVSAFWRSVQLGVVLSKPAGRKVCAKVKPSDF